MSKSKEILNILEELSRSSGNVIRNAGKLLGSPVVHYGASVGTKHYVRRKYGLHKEIGDFKAAKHAIRKSKNKDFAQKTRDLNTVEKEHLKKIAHKIHTTRKAQGKKSNPRKALRSAKRAVYGTTFGTRVL